MTQQPNKCLTLKDISDLPDEQWDAAVLGFENGTMFHTSAWLKVLQEGLGLELVKLGIFKNGRLAGLFPFLQKRMFGFKIAGSPLYVETVPSLGPVGDLENHEILEPLMEYIRATQVRYMRVFFNNSVPTVRIGKNMNMIERHTHINDLDIGKEKVWNNIKMQCRNKIRKGEKNNLEVIIDEGFRNVEAYLGLVKRLYNDQGVVSPKPIRLYEKIHSENRQKKIIQVLFAKYEGKIIGGLILALNRNTINLIDSATLTEYKKLQVGNFLTWKAMEWAVDNGYKKFDLSGSDVERIAEFKASFGGTLTSYSCVEIANPKFIFRAREAYSKNRYRLDRLTYSLQKMSTAIVTYTKPNAILNLIRGWAS